MESEAAALAAGTQSDIGSGRAATGSACAAPSRRLLPLAGELPRVVRGLLHISVACLLAIGLLDALHVFLGLAPGWEDALHGPVVAVAEVLGALAVLARAASARRDRLRWWLAAAGFSSYAVGSVLWYCWLQLQPHPPSPSIADVFWLATYPLVGAALALCALASSRHGDRQRIIVDALVTTSAVVALCVAFVVPPLVRAAVRQHGALAADLIYPMADVAIGVMLIALLSIRDWRPDRRWALALTAFGLWLLGDSFWAIQIGGGAGTASSAVNLCYIAALPLLAMAAWQHERMPSDRAPAVQRSSLVASGLLALIAPAILIYDHFAPISLVALILTWMALLAGIARVTLAMRDALMLRDVQRTAMTDELTQLPNRRLFLARLREAVSAVERDGGSITALMLDLDNFKQLNDTLGHDAGDELLRLAGPRLVGAVGGRALVARLGGDEFAILLEPGSSRTDACAAARRVLESFDEPLRVHGLALRLTASVGIASFPHDADTPETLLKRADVAMYDAKRGRNGWALYSSQRDANTRERLEMPGELAAALAGEEIEVVFQAIADTGTRRVRTAEALVRWRRADGSLRPPGEFLEAAELAGLSRQLTRRVLALALDNARSWRFEHGYPVAVSVNTTVADLLDDGFPDEVRAALEARGLGPDTLKIEVTESLIMANPERVSAVLARLRAFGVRIALDDFGTGYSSLTHLRQLPVDRLKIDRSFVTTMCSEPTDAAIVYATIELAHRLGLKVIAEGVEDEATWQALQEIDCDAVQGYHLSRPLEPARFLELLDESYLAASQSLPAPASTASGGSIG